MAAERNNSFLRTLDRYLGIPVVAVLGVLSKLRRRTRPPAVRRIGLLKTAGIGDTILLSGIARDIAARGDVELYLFTGRENAAAARLIEGVREVVMLPMTRPLTAIRMMRRYPLDLLIDCGPWPRINAVLTATSRARYTVGFRTPGQWRHFALDLAVDHSCTVHEIDNYRRLAEGAGFSTGAAPQLARGAPVPRALLPMRPFIVCHLWSAGYLGYRKEWRAERWRAVIERLVAGGHDVVLTGGPADRDATAAFHRELDAASVRVHDLSGKLDLGQTLELLRRAELVVSVNTGIMHMASAVDVPVVSLEGPVSVRRWGPIGDHASSVVSTHRGAGFLHLGWEYAGAPSDTMDGVSVADVLAAITTVLGEEEPVVPRSVRARTRASGARGGRALRADRDTGDNSTLAS